MSCTVKNSDTRLRRWMERLQTASGSIDMLFDCTYATRQLEREQAEERPYQSKSDLAHGRIDDGINMDFCRHCLFDEDECYRRCELEKKVHKLIGRRRLWQSMVSQRSSHDLISEKSLVQV
uniref:Uncharacterized protein n=1 Tax=Odontella aurita TaxID=265563 RepID=A0A7S4M7R3_9STRA|mmetsp:Transcript_13782/g.40291  ORF Transcript_13782/g.40291 Transcript_13782/m.40291 type:complete len:121 (+) Transcript_13782:266-628(+)